MKAWKATTSLKFPDEFRNYRIKMKPSVRRLRAILREPYLLLLTTTILGLLSIAIADHTNAQGWVFTIIIMAILLSGVYSLDANHPNNRPWVAFGLLAAISQGVMFFQIPGHIRIFFALVVIVYFGLLTVRMVTQVAGSKRINLHVLLGSISIYILVGISAALLFVAVEVSNPEALYFSYTKDPNLHDFIYYSFVTMSTLGYGDVTPKAPIAQFLAYSLALVGQLYMTVLVAFLVGKFISEK